MMDSQKWYGEVKPFCSLGRTEDTDFSSLTIPRHGLICFSHFIRCNELTNVLKAEPFVGHMIKLIRCALSSVFLFSIVLHFLVPSLTSSSISLGCIVTLFTSASATPPCSACLFLNVLEIRLLMTRNHQCHNFSWKLHLNYPSFMGVSQVGFLVMIELVGAKLEVWDLSSTQWTHRTEVTA